MNRPWSGTVLLAVLTALSLLALPGPSQAQLVRVRNDYYVTELRPAKNMIGIARTNSGRTQNWVEVTPTTRLGIETRHDKRAGYSMRYLSHNEIWTALRPGSHIRVEGGRDWNNHVKARLIWAAVP